MSRPERFWGRWKPATLTPPAASDGHGGGMDRSDRQADALAVGLALVLGALVLALAPNESDQPRTIVAPGVDAAMGLVCSAILWWRRRWPLGVALATLAIGAPSITATGAGLIALFSLAAYRGLRPALLTAALWLPVALACAAALGRTDLAAVVGYTVAMVVAAVAWGMFVRARRQLFQSLRERAERAEADQDLHAEKARVAERHRIAREMHDVLAHRVSLLALQAGALEVRPDLAPEQVRETAVLLRTTARQALDELRSVIGVLRAGQDEEPVLTAPQPTLADIPRLVEETRRADVRVEFDMRVDQPDRAPGAVGRDAYRVVQEALTNMAKHARGTEGHVLVSGGPGSGLHVSVSNRLPLRLPAEPSLPGSGAGLLGLQERVALAGGALVHGPDGAGNFVVEADLRW